MPSVKGSDYTPNVSLINSLLWVSDSSSETEGTAQHYVNGKLIKTYVNDDNSSGEGTYQSKHSLERKTHCSYLGIYMINDFRLYSLGRYCTDQQKPDQNNV